MRCLVGLGASWYSTNQLGAIWITILDSLAYILHWILAIASLLTEYSLHRSSCYYMLSFLAALIFHH